MAIKEPILSIFEERTLKKSEDNRIEHVKFINRSHDPIVCELPTT